MAELVVFNPNTKPTSKDVLNKVVRLVSLYDCVLRGISPGKLGSDAVNLDQVKSLIKENSFSQDDVIELLTALLKGSKSIHINVDAQGNITFSVNISGQTGNGISLLDDGLFVSSASSSFGWFERPNSGVQDDVNLDFTTNSNYVPGTLKVFRDGVLEKNITETGTPPSNTFSLISVPPSVDTDLQLLYIKA